MQRSETGTPTGTWPPRGAPPPSEPPTSGGSPPAGTEPAGDPDERRHGLAWGLALIAIGTLWLLSLTGLAIPWELLLPGALIGIGLLVLARPRQEGGGLIALGIVVLVIGLLQPGVPTSGSISAGDRMHTVTDVADLDDTYALGAGTLVLDLRELDLGDPEAGDPPVEVAGRVTMGELIVLVPEDAHVRGDARVVLGEVAHFGRSAGGIAPSVTLDDASGSDGSPVIDLDLRVTLGQIEVRR